VPEKVGVIEPVATSLSHCFEEGITRDFWRRKSAKCIAAQEFSVKSDAEGMSKQTNMPHLDVSDKLKGESTNGRD
jgi:hypothetical protein